MRTTPTLIRATAAMSVLSLGACMAPSESPRPAAVSQPVAVTKVIRADGAGGYFLPDGTRVVRDTDGGFVLPNGSYVTRTTSGDLLLPNGNVCRPSGRDFICP